MSTSAPLQLRSSQRKRLRGLAHPLHPVVQVGRGGLGEALLAAIDQELASHELIKVRLAGEREERRAQAAAIEERLGCALAGLVGHVAILYRPAADLAERRIDPGA